MICKATHIGIDLDNTIICYDDSFYRVGVEHGFIPEHVNAEKSEVKTYLTGLPGGQYQWEKLQGLVYGKQIHQASIFTGILDFIDACATLKIKVSIVSHKTLWAHHDPDKTNLRKAALSFLQKNEILSSDRLGEDEIYFCGTLKEKVRTIEHLNCCIFIDDLIKVFEHPAFPPTCHPILFRGHSLSFQCCPSWEHIHHAILA